MKRGPRASFSNLTEGDATWPVIASFSFLSWPTLSLFAEVTEVRNVYQVHLDLLIAMMNDVACDAKYPHTSKQMG